MFRGTPCIFYYFTNPNSNNTDIFLVAQNHQYRGFIINLRPNMFSFSNKRIENSTIHATGRDGIFRVSSSAAEWKTFLVQFFVPPRIVFVPPRIVFVPPRIVFVPQRIVFVPPRIVFASLRKIELFCTTVCYPLKPWE